MDFDQIQSQVPKDIEAEQAFIGSVFENPELLHRVIDMTPDKFWSVSHQLIWGAILTLHQARSPIDEVTVGDKLKARDSLEEVGGYAYLAELSECAPSNENIRAYSSIITEKYLIRQLLEVSKDAGEGARDPGKDPKIIIDLAITRMMDIRDSLSTREKTVVSAGEVANRVFEQITHMADGGPLPGVPSGFDELDGFLSGGFIAPEVIYLGARPSKGKTSLATRICTHIAETDKKSLIFTLETGRESLVRDRLIPQIASIEPRFLRSGQLDTQAEWDRLAAAVNDLSNMKNLRICDSGGINVLEIEQVIRIESQSRGLDFVVIDFFQLIRPLKRLGNRNLELGEVSRALKAIAKKYHIPILVLSQLSRECEKHDRKPVRTDLRDCGEIEQDADIIILLHSHKDDDLVECIFDKNRNGMCGTAFLRFVKKWTRYQDRHLPTGV